MASSTSACRRAAISPSISITRSKTWASRSARRCAKRSATKPVSAASARPPVRSTRRWCGVTVDLSGRPFFVYEVAIKRARVGTFDTELIHDFLLALTNQLGMNLHVDMVRGRNAHHIIEATFKALARALDSATQVDPRVEGVLSTKGAL